MKKITVAYKISSWAFGIILGIGHLLTELFGPKDPKAVEILKSMPVNLPGKETDIYSIMFGISIIMGVLLISYGVFNLFVLKLVQKKPKQLKIAICLNIVIVFTVFLLALEYLFIFPIVLIGISFICLLFAGFFISKTDAN